MSRVDHIDYFRKRAAAERELAKAAAEKYIARIHEQMAEHYEALIDAPDERDRLRIVGEACGAGAFGTWYSA
jgi:hypothetical protein